VLAVNQAAEVERVAKEDEARAMLFAVSFLIFITSMIKLSLQPFIGLGGQSVPLGAVANIRYEVEQPTIWRRSRLPTITLQSSIHDDVQPNTVVEQLAPRIAEFSKQLPNGYSVAVGGSVEESAKSQGPIKAVIPLMLFVMATILMVQLQSFHRLFLVCAVAPLAVIGVVTALLPSGAPLGSSPFSVCWR